MRSLLKRDNRGVFQVASEVIWGIVGFLIVVIVGLLVVGTLVGGGFFTSTSDAQGALNNISSNLTAGINTVTGKLPTVFTVTAIVVILAILGLLVVLVRKYGMSGGSFSQ